MLVQVSAKPACRHGPESVGCRPSSFSSHRSGKSPEIRVVVAHEAVRSIVFPGSAPAGYGKLPDQGKKRFMKLGQSADFRSPVIHLRINVYRIVRAPGRTHLGIPDSLKICRLGSRTGARNEQITPVVKKQFIQSHIRSLRIKGPDPLVRGKLPRIRIIKDEIRAVKIRHIFRPVSALCRLVIHASCMLHIGPAQSGLVSALCIRLPHKSAKAGADTDADHGFVRTNDGQSVFCSLYSTVCRLHRHDHHKPHSLLGILL